MVWARPVFLSDSQKMPSTQHLFQPSVRELHYTHTYTHTCIIDKLAKLLLTVQLSLLLSQRPCTQLRTYMCTHVQTKLFSISYTYHRTETESYITRCRYLVVYEASQLSFVYSDHITCKPSLILRSGL